jgi:hypothetical protein
MRTEEHKPERRANVNVGDRVRYTDEGQIFERIVIPDGDEHGWAVASSDANSEWGKRTYEVVQSAHYAPPGVPMVALTPERMAALEKAREALYHRIQFDSYRRIGPNNEIVAQYEAVEGILSEARGDVGYAKQPGWSKLDDDFAERMAKRGWSIREIRESEQISGQVICVTPAAAYIHAGRGSVVAVPAEHLERVPQKDSLVRVALTSAGARYDWLGAGEGLDRE